MDDEIDNLVVFESAFRWHFQIFTANSALNALQILEKNPDIALLIADERMPEMSGLNLIEIVLKKYPDIINIILTGFGDLQTIIKAINMGGIYHYVTKPWKQEELKITIENALESYELRQQNKALIINLQQANKELEEYAKTLETKVEERTKELNALKDELEEKIQQRTSKLSSAYMTLLDFNKELDNYIYRASHDIAGPLARFAGLCNIALIESQDSSSQTYFKLLKDEAENLRYILTNLIRENEIKYRRLHLVEIDFHSLIKEVLESMHSVAGYQEVQINVQVAKDLHFENDPLLLRFIFFYLLHNAILYRIDNQARQAEVNISIIPILNEGVKITIADNGIGISEEIQGKVFERFFRGTSKSKGNGMGLYLAKAAVHQLNGSIHLESELNIGTTFEIFLPKG
ncbi:Signal transduction histidine kinase [Thermoflexibacter ruber]|uniref:histidine kinase n=1 Tax=Thermoflexibacter ruber TaxID=1003 RepID=A0A1I2GZQ6_9BACT|nr:Signal transduction histidine kinase [Thermoflexibacter ruber]